jgi:thiol:disulfide interchange protein DsbD
VVGALALLFAALGLNLSGLFEFRSFVPSNLAGLQWANPITNSLWSGVFAVVIASPCTAPFMGASLGLAIGLPAWQALPVFLAMGFGMALPFMAITLSTGWVKLLPRPGAWMQTFRQFMAFPMYATVVWLVWVLGQQVGLDGAIGFLACLLSLTLLIWALSLHGPGARAITALALLVGALSIWQWGPTWAFESIVCKHFFQFFSTFNFGQSKSGLGRMVGRQSGRCPKRRPPCVCRLHGGLVRNVPI